MAKLAKIFEIQIDEGRVNVFWEDKRRIAFNYGGRLFFNSHFAETLHPDLKSHEALSYWYVVFCHELAHNTEKGHNKTHEAAEELLLATYMSACWACSIE